MPAEGKSEKPFMDDEETHASASSAEKKKKKESRGDGHTKEDKKRREQKEKAKDSGKKYKDVSFEDAHFLASALNEMRARKQIGSPGVVHMEMLDKIRHILEEASAYDDKPPSLFSAKEALVIAHKLLKISAEIEPTEADKLKFGDYLERGRESIADAKSASEDEIRQLEAVAPLTGEANISDGGMPEKIKQLYEKIPEEDDTPDELRYFVREYNRIVKSKGWQGMIPADIERLKELQSSLVDFIKEGKMEPSSSEYPVFENVRNLVESSIDQRHMDLSKAAERPSSIEDVYDTMRQTKSDIKDMLTESEGTEKWNRAKQRFKNNVGLAKVKTEGSEKDYQFVYEVNRAIDEAFRDAKVRDAKDRDQEDKFISVVGEQVMENFVNKSDKKKRYLLILEEHFEDRWRNMSNQKRKEIAGDIERLGAIYISAAISGWRSTTEAAVDLKQLVEKYDDSEGFRKWRGIKSIEGVQRQVDEHLKNQIPAVPEDIPEKVNEMLFDVESAGLSEDDLNNRYQKALGLVLQMPGDSEVARTKREHLLRRLEAFKGVHIFLLQFERSDANPQGVMDTFTKNFEGREEETFGDFVERYGEDARGRKFYAKKKIGRDETGREILIDCETPEKINLFDIQFGEYSETLRHERITMNIIEEMTKYHWGKFDVSAMRRKSGYENFSPELKNYWNLQFEYLKSYLGEEYKQLTLERSAKGKKTASWGTHGEGVDMMNKVVSNWHNKRSLHGAFGIISADDLKEMMFLSEDALGDDQARIYFEKIKEKGLDLSNADDFENFYQKIEGMTFLKLRRALLTERVKEKIKDMGLSIYVRENGEEELIGIDAKELEDSQYINSLDLSAQKFAWFMLWSNYDNIRIYSDKKTPWDDDFDSVVFHRSTSMFNARAIDHLWEFFNADVENRGLAQDDETNVIFKQFLPGKHHYLFPQNTVAVRWANDAFMTDAQKDEVAKRIEVMKRKYDFNNTKRAKDFSGWIRSVVVMDMIENGEIAIGVGDNTWSRLTEDKKLGKFEMIDLFGDRQANLTFTGPEILQDYLIHPTEETFNNINQRKNFYSKRVARQYPWSALALRAHWEIVNQHNERIRDKPNVQVDSMEKMVNKLVYDGDVDKGVGVDFKRKHLGFMRYSPHGDQDELPQTAAPGGGIDGTILGNSMMRNIRKFLESRRREAWEIKWSPFMFFVGFLVGLFAETTKRLPGQAFGEGRR